MNFAISLSCWDYIFATFAEPNENGDILLGFEGDSEVPTSFWKQLLHPLI